MSKHTPGPWLVASDGNVVSERAGIVERIAVSIFCSKERREANAHLIAAAPQMLDALERLCEAVRALDEQIGAIHDKIVITDAVSLLQRQNEVLSAVKQAEAAIAAAKGEA